MPQPAADAPFLELFLFFFGIVFVRTQVTYWLARAVAHQAVKRADSRTPRLKRLTAWMSRDSTQRGVLTVQRWGPLAVFASFFMTGTKTVINSGAGLIKMPFALYLPTMALGCIAHALIYALVGWAAWTAALQAAAGSPQGLSLLLITITAVATGLYVHRRKRRKTAAAVSPALPHSDSPHQAP